MNPFLLNGYLKAGSNKPKGFVKLDEAGLLPADAVQVTNESNTAISGLIKGSGGKIAQAVAGEDYAAPSAVEALQTQINELVVEGDSSVEAAQARVPASGDPFATLKERLDSSDGRLEAVEEKTADDIPTAETGVSVQQKLSTVTSQLAANTTYINTLILKMSVMRKEITSWATVQQLVRDGYGPTAFPIGSQLSVLHSAYGLGGRLIFDVVAHDHHKNPSDPTAHTMSLHMRDVIYGRQFDAIEALYYCASELPAGTYNFTLLAEYDTAYGGGKTLQFTTTKAVPAGGVIMFPWGSSTQSTDTKISTHSARESTTAIESNLSVIEGTNGTNLGTADGLTPNMNHSHRIRYGSNNYSESAIRQWIKSAAAANAWWTPQTIFDRPPTYANVAGFLSDLDPEFVAILGAPEIVTIRNTLYEIDGTIGGSYTTNDLVFLPSMTELGFGKNNNIDEGALLEYYDGVVNADRIKYDITALTTARYWWLRGPIPSHAYTVRGVNSDGSLLSYSASVGIGAVAACVIM